MKKHYNIADFNVIMNCRTKGMLKLLECYKGEAKALLQIDNMSRKISCRLHIVMSKKLICAIRKKNEKKYSLKMNH